MKKPNDFGVHLTLPNESDASHVVLVYEGRDPFGTGPQFDLPRRRPSGDELAEFERTLKEAQGQLVSSLGDQSDILAKSVPVPARYAFTSLNKTALLSVKLGTTKKSESSSLGKNKPKGITTSPSVSMLLHSK